MKKKKFYGTFLFGHSHEKRFRRMLGVVGVLSVMPIGAVQATEDSAMETAAMVQQQANKVSGKIIDSKGEPIIGATVQIAGTSQGVVTDIDGHFSMEVPIGANLHVSYVGYKGIDIKLGKKTELSIVLQEDNKLLEEVVVVGYGTMKRKEMTSAISHVSSYDLNKVATMDASMLLQGKVSSVSIMNTNVGDPNTMGSIQVRGISSRNAGLGPLIVVDGIPGGDLTNINPNDIESIDVLKDGAASAIYGTRGSNGVILVNLKKGARDGQLHTSYSASLTVMQPKRELDFLSADEFRKYRCIDNPGLDFGGDVDWFDAVGRTALTHLHTITLSGGDNKTNYRVSVDYRNAQGIVIETNRQEYGLRAGINHTTKSGLFFFSANVAPRVVNMDIGSTDSFYRAVNNNPTVPIYDEESDNGYWHAPAGVNGADNQVEWLNTVSNDKENKRLEWNGTAGLNILPLFNPKNSDMTLKTQLTFSQKYDESNTGYYVPSTNTSQIIDERNGHAKRSWDKSMIYNLEWTTNFTAKFNDHQLRAMAGYSYNYGMYEGFNIENRDFDNDGLTYNNMGQGTQAAEEGIVGMGSYKNDYKLISFFGRINYDWKERYLLTTSLRYEGSSRFGINNKWGYFPAVSVGWRISEESFMSGIDWIDDLKLRYDFGVTGNQDFSSYMSLATYSSFGWYEYQGELFHVWGTSKNVNGDLRWEKGMNQNIGLDFSLFNGRIGGSLNYFIRKQVDLLGDYDVAVPPNLHTTIFANVGTLRNQGLEIDLNFVPVQNKDFTWSFNIIAATNDNRFLEFSNDIYSGQKYYSTCNMDNPGNPGYLQRIEEGKRVGNFFTYRYAGVDDNGNWMVYSKDGEVIPIADASEDDKTYTGNGLPKFTGSMTHNFLYRNFDFSLSFSGAAGFELFNTHNFYWGLQTATNGNVLKRAYKENAEITSGYNVLSDYFIEPGSYLKIDDVTLGYTFKPQNKYIGNIRVYGSARNLYTFTKFSGVDPSTYNVNGLTPGSGDGHNNYYPSVFQFNMGVQVNF